jgi:hypothetical protein
VRELRRDEDTDLALMVDRRDPPRYYVSSRKRVDLICIGDAKAAEAAFDEQVRKAKRRRQPAPPKSDPGQGL